MEHILEAFLEESLELLKEASSSVLQLERDPTNKEEIDVLFRAMHTMKGSSALFDLQPMTKLVHAAEDALHSVRADKLTLSSELVDLFLECIDLASSWVAVLEDGSALPETAQEEADPLIARIKALSGADQKHSIAAAPLAESEVFRDVRPPWLQLDGRIADFVGKELVAFEYTPDPGCFFQGDDPLRFISLVPQLIHLEINELHVPGESDDDPFVCRTGFRVVTETNLDTLKSLFNYVYDQVKFYVFRISFARGIDTALRLLHGLEAALEVPPEVGVAAIRRQSYVKMATTLLEHGNFPRKWLEQFTMSSRLALLEESDKQLSVAIHHIVNSVAEAQRCGSNLSIMPVPIGADAPPVVISRVRIPEVGATSAPRLTSVGSQQGAAVASDRAVVAQPAPPPRVPKEAAPRPSRAPQPAKAGGATQRQQFTANSYKIDQERIDDLLELAGELLVAKNALPYLARRAEELGAATQLAREVKDQAAILSRIADSFHHAVMQLRIIPVSHVFERFPRMVRDVGRKLNKSVRLEVHGEHTEADKSTVERVGDPLVHVIRNSLDHGIESPEERAAAGKPAEGCIRLTAEQSRGMLVITVEDDGRGVDPERVKAVAIRRGLLKEEDADSLTDDQAIGLLFQPGFSTSETVSDLSGRGVGMDVVRSAVESYGGQVQFRSTLGAGTAIIMSLPLSMAVAKVLLVNVVGHTFGVPFELVLETMHVSPEQVASVRGGKVVSIRERVVPVFHLQELLQLTPTQPEPGVSTEAQDSEHLTILLARTPAGEVGLLVDAFQEVVDVMLKPLTEPLTNLRGYLGTCLLGDGRALLVLNLADLT